MQLRSLGRATLGGWLYGALLFGGVLSFEHVLYNRLGGVADSLITLAVFLLLYGAWGAGFFAAAWLLRQGWRLLPFRRAAAASAGAPAGEVWAAGLALFNLVFWEVFFLYGLTYDQAPFGHPQSKWGMLGVLLALALPIGAGAWVASRLQVWVFRGLLRHRRLGGVATAFVLLLVLLHALAAWRANPEPRPRPARAEGMHDLPPPLPPVVRRPTGLKVVVVGLDGADWRVLRPMMERGELPNFSRAVAEGSSADLESIHDSNSAVIWASIYTGMLPERHGALDFYRIALPGMRSRGLFPLHRTFFKELADLASRVGLTRQVPVDRFSIADAPYWEIAERFGASLGVVDGYFYSFPALRLQKPESWFFTYGLNEVAARAPKRVDLFVQPPRLFRELRGQLGGDDFDWQSAILDARLALGQPELINFYTHQPDSVQHWFWKWYEPGKYFGVRREDVEKRGDLIPKQQRAFDALLGRIEARVSPDTVVLVVSDHGHSPTLVHNLYSQHRHGPPGILTLRGGPVRPGVKLTASVYDVYPTVLYLLGLPVPKDAAGKVLVEALDPAFVRAHPIRTLPSYRPYGASPGLPGAARDGAMNEAEIEKLRSLGYIF